jgi:hypothetical protein
MTAAERYDNAMRWFTVNIPYCLPGEDIETDVVFSVAIQQGEIQSIQVGYGYVGEHIRNENIDSIRAQAIEQWQQDRDDYINAMEAKAKT